MAVGLIKGWFGDEVKSNRVRMPTGKKSLERVQEDFVFLIETECNHACETLFQESMAQEQVSAAPSSTKKRAALGSWFAAPKRQVRPFSKFR